MHPFNIHSGSYVLLAIGIVLVIAAIYLKNLAERFISLPYRKKHLFSEAEKRFFRALESAVRNEHVKIFAKVRLADIFSVGRLEQKYSWRDFAKISQKHVDFLLVDAGSLEPIMGVELDDSSHLTNKGRERDGFVNSVFKAAELPLHHIRASGWYDLQAIRQVLFETGKNAPIGDKAGVSVPDMPSRADA
jgi:hypothetical protein